MAMPKRPILTPMATRKCGAPVLYRYGVQMDEALAMLLMKPKAAARFVAGPGTFARVLESY